MDKTNTNKKRSTPVRTLAEGGIAVALSIALSYVEIQLGTQGGSVDIVMVPLIVFALRHGAGVGVLASLVFGTLKYVFANGFAISWVSILFDYSGAYAVVGLAGLAATLFVTEKGITPARAVTGTLIGGLLRYFVHFVSGVTVYAEYMPDEFLGLPMNSLAIYSLLYNGLYMVPNIIAAVILVPVVIAGLRRARV